MSISDWATVRGRLGLPVEHDRHFRGLGCRRWAPIFVDGFPVDGIGSF
ncbi:hypothetical protein [Mesorhizobium sp. 128a]